MPEAASRATITDFNTLRAMGIPIDRAAQYVGRKKSWGYQQEQKRKLTGGQPAAIRLDAGTSRAYGSATEEASWQDAVDLIVALDDPDDPAAKATAARLQDTYGLDLLRMVAHVASYLAHYTARSIQDHLLELHDEEEWWEEIKNDPVVTKDILLAIPASIEEWEPLLPERAKKWEERLLEAHPDFAVISEESAKAEETDDPDVAHRELRRRIKAGDFDPEHLREPAMTNGHD